MGQITAVIPTRGLVFAETLISLRNNGIPDPIIINNLPLPDSHNTAIAEALKTGCDYVWMLEDDTVTPAGGLKALLALNTQVACIDYAVRGGYSTVGYGKSGKIIHCGMGSTLMKREVFEKMPAPWFENDRGVDAKTGKLISYKYKYGGLDIIFGVKVNQLGMTIKKVPGMECKHMRCSDLVRKEVNNGQYAMWSEPPVKNVYRYPWG